MTEMAVNWNIKFEKAEDLQKYNAFAEKLEQDTETMAKLDAADSLEEFFAAGKKYLTCTFEQFRQLYDKLVQDAEKCMSEIYQDRELNDGELDMVIGGSRKGWRILKKIAVCVAAGVGVSLASATIGAFVAGGIGSITGGAAAGAVGGLIGGAAVGYTGFMKGLVGK